MAAGGRYSRYAFGRELSLGVPWFLVWNPEYDDGGGSEKGGGEVAAEPGAADGNDGEDGSGRRMRRKVTGAD